MTDAELDVLIDRSGLIRRRCIKRSNGCTCGHIKQVHGTFGSCRARRRQKACPCERFTPRDYAEHDNRTRLKLRAFARAVLGAL